MAKLPGWKRLPGRNERYIDPSGKEVSRRQYENERARHSGWRNWSDYQQTRKSDDYNRWVKRAIDEQGLTRRDIGPGTEFSRQYLQVSAMRQLQNQSVEGETDYEIAENALNSPDGPLAQLLISAGLRPPDAEYDVGDTP